MLTDLWTMRIVRSMALLEPDYEPDGGGEIPLDSFRTRIAMIRALRGWNYTQAGVACGISAESWRQWEKLGTRPRDYETVCRDIARGSGFNPRWITAGGPLRISWFSPVPATPGQMTLALGVERPVLVAV